MLDAAERLERVEVLLAAAESGQQLSLFPDWPGDGVSPQALATLRCRLLDELGLVDEAIGFDSPAVDIGGRRYFRSWQAVRAEHCDQSGL